MTNSPSIRLALVLASAIAAAALPLRAQQNTNQPGTTWTEEQLRQSVELARVGRKLTPKSWPNGARVAVCLSFDTDTEAPLLRDGTTSPTALSASDFGAESGTPRILQMLDRYQIPATFFMTGGRRDAAPGHARRDSEERAPRSRRARLDPRVHAAARPTDEEERLLDQAIEYLTKATGKRPVGYRAPSWAFSASRSI